MLLQLRSWWWQKKSIARISAWSRRRIGLLSLSPASDRSKACSMACCGGATRRPRRWACSRKYARTATAAMEYLSVDWLASSEVSFFFSRCWSTTARGASPTSGALIIIDSSFTELHLQSHSADTHCPAKGCVESTHASHGISMQSVPPGLSRFRMLKIHAAPASDPRSSAKGAASCPWIPWAPQDSNFFTAKRAVEGQSRLVSRWLSTRSNTLSMVRPASSVMISVTGKSCGKTLVTSSASMFNRGTKREEYNEGCMAAKVRYIVARIIKRISGMPHCPAMVMIGRIAPGWLASWRYLARKLVEVGCGKPTTNCEMFVKKTTRILWRCGRVVRSVSFECQVKAYKDRNAKSRDKSSSLQTLALLSASEELLLMSLMLHAPGTRPLRGRLVSCPKRSSRVQTMLSNVDPPSQSPSTSNLPVTERHNSAAVLKWHSWDALVAGPLMFQGLQRSHREAHPAHCYTARCSLRRVQHSIQKVHGPRAADLHVQPLLLQPCHLPPSDHWHLFFAVECPAPLHSEL